MKFLQYIIATALIGTSLSSGVMAMDETPGEGGEKHTRLSGGVSGGGLDAPRKGEGSGDDEEEEGEGSKTSSRRSSVSGSGGAPLLPSAPVEVKTKPINGGLKSQITIPKEALIAALKGTEVTGKPIAVELTKQIAERIAHEAKAIDDTLAQEKIEKMISDKSSDLVVDTDFTPDERVPDNPHELSEYIEEQTKQVMGFLNIINPTEKKLEAVRTSARERGNLASAEILRSNSGKRKSLEAIKASEVDHFGIGGKTVRSHLRSGSPATRIQLAATEDHVAALTQAAADKDSEIETLKLAHAAALATKDTEHQAALQAATANAVSPEDRAVLAAVTSLTDLYKEKFGDDFVTGDFVQDTKKLVETVAERNQAVAKLSRELKQKSSKDSHLTKGSPESGKTHSGAKKDDPASKSGDGQLRGIPAFDGGAQHPSSPSSAVVSNSSQPHGSSASKPAPTTVDELSLDSRRLYSQRVDDFGHEKALKEAIQHHQSTQQK